MPTANSRLIMVTDDRGRCVLGEDDNFEPLPGSVVLSNGRFGTAWQRHFGDGLWHPASGTGNPRRWAQMLKMKGVFIVYDAEERGV